MTLRRTEPRHDALRAAAEERLTFVAGRLGGGLYHVELPGMPGETTSSRQLNATVIQLLNGVYLRHSRPGVPRPSGPIELTEDGRLLLSRWDERNAQ